MNSGFTISEKPKALHYAIFSALICLYLLTRFSNIGKLPIFTDEAVFIRWAQIIIDNPSELFISLRVDAKQPLFHWLSAITLNISHDPLISIRSVSLIAGLFTTIGVYLIGKSLYSKSVGMLASIMYILCPYTLLYDRIGIADSLMSAFGTYALLFSIMISQTGLQNKKLFIALGLVLAGGFLTRSTALSLYILPLMTVCILSDSKIQFRLRHLFIFSYAVALAIIMSINFGVGTPGGTNPVYRESRFFLDSKELFSVPVSRWIENSKEISSYVFTGLTPLLSILFIISIFMGVLNKDKRIMVLFIWFFLPIAIVVLIGKILFPRYILFCVPPALVIAATSIVSLAKNKEKPSKVVTLTSRVLILLLLLYCSYTDFYIVTNPIKANFIAQDKFQYVNGWPSGYGIPEAAKYLEEKASKNSIAVFTTTLWGNPGDAITIYLKGRPNITVYEAWWWKESAIIPPNIETAELGKSKYLKGVGGKIYFQDLKEVYFVTDSYRHPADSFLYDNPNFKRVAAFKKPNGITSIDIYKLNR